jgi:catechol 2,3-dioxygenase-like lactoylglutathione lyase family enzyme
MPVRNSQVSDVGTAIQHHHTALHVLDLERSAAFYVDGLGLSRLEEWTSGRYIGELFGRPGVNVRAVLLTAGNGSFRLELVQVDAPPPAVDPSGAPPGTAHLAFSPATRSGGAQRPNWGSDGFPASANVTSPRVGWSVQGKVATDLDGTGKKGCVDIVAHTFRI